MSAPSPVGVSGPSLRLRGHSYPILLPKLSDPRLWLATTFVCLHTLGQVEFQFRVSIPQILTALLTAAVLEVAIAFHSKHVILWPASALLTANGIAFIMRVPGTEHGDWWSTRGLWIYATVSAVALLSKYLIKFRGEHIFNPSNLALVLVFLILGSQRTEPLQFWWGPLSVWLVLVLGVIVVGALLILSRLNLLWVAIGFWLTFAAAIGVLSLSGHAMSANWHVGPVSDGYFWTVLLFSPEVFIFLSFMITDPKTVPRTRNGRLIYAVSIGLLAALLIAPQRSEFGAKVGLLGALTLICAARPLDHPAPRADGRPGTRRLPLPRASPLRSDAAAPAWVRRRCSQASRSRACSSSRAARHARAQASRAARWPPSGCRRSRSRIRRESPRSTSTRGCRSRVTSSTTSALRALRSSRGTSTRRPSEQEARGSQGCRRRSNQRQAARSSCPPTASSRWGSRSRRG